MSSSTELLAAVRAATTETPYIVRETPRGFDLTIDVADARWLAPIRAHAVEVTVLVLTVNVAVVLPAGTVTVAGTVAAGSLLLNAITTPPAGAGATRITVPAEVAPPVTLTGVRSTSPSKGTTLTDTVFVTPL